MRVEIDNNYINLLPINLRQFRLHTDSEDIVLKHDENGFITTVIINDSFKLKLGKSIEIDDMKYVINYIKRDRDDIFQFFQEKVTKTSQFIMPLLGGTYDYYDLNDTFYNSYLSKDYKSIYLVYKFKPTETYLEIEDRLTKHPLFIEMKDPDVDTVVFKFKLPEEFHKDIQKVMKGMYSSISPTFKSKICIFHKFGVKSRTFRMLHRDVELRKEMSEEFGCEIPDDVELMSKPFIEKEVWLEVPINKPKELIKYD